MLLSVMLILETLTQIITDYFYYSKSVFICVLKHSQAAKSHTDQADLADCFI